MSPRLRKGTIGPEPLLSGSCGSSAGKSPSSNEHLGSAHTPADLPARVAAGVEKLANYGAAEELELELGLPRDETTSSRARAVVGSRSAVLIDTITESWTLLGFNEAIDVQAFFHLVLARLVEPTSKAASFRGVSELVIGPPHHNTFLNCLTRANDHDYWAKIAAKCFDYSVATSGIGRRLYEVTTLYFEAVKEDDLRKVGYSNGRRVDPQIVVGLLVDRIGISWRSAATKAPRSRLTRSFRWLRLFRTDMVIAADDGMLSPQNLKEFDAARLRFIVGSGQTKALHDLATYFRWSGEYAEAGQIIDTITPKGVKRLDPERVKKESVSTTREK